MSDDEVEAIKTDSAHKFSAIRKMAEALDEGLGTVDMFQGIAESWRALSGFTHSGLEQLAMGFNADGDLQPSYPDKKCCHLLRSSTSTLLLMLPPILREWRMNHKAEAVEAWLIEETPSPC